MTLQVLQTSSELVCAETVQGMDSTRIAGWGGHILGLVAEHRGEY